MKPLKTEITAKGQPYFDEPVYVEVSKANPLAHAIAHIVGRQIPGVIRDLSHHERTRLRWVKPNRRG